MEEGTKKLIKKIAIAVLILLIIILMAFIAYRLWFEFDNKTIQGYINQEAAKYQDPTGTAVIINDSVKDILNNRNLVRQVKDFAKLSNITLEQALVSAAIAEAKTFYPQQFVLPQPAPPQS